MNGLRRLLSSRVLGIAACALTTTGLLLTAPDLDADPGDYYHCYLAGSVGIVDEADMDEVRFASGRAMFRNSVDSGKVTLRYPVDIIQLNNNGTGITLADSWIRVRWRDNGGKARVVVKLKSYRFATGATATLEVWDSNSRPQSDSYQSYWHINGSPSYKYDTDTAYWFEVTLTKSNASGRPELGGISFWAEEQ